eukprot:TRINITY_DN13606_c0_g1_i1.p2 TRINITY_DN13606_c0_g1~~TRINITY_DN13606_c0_g1_i1.p2  ORF type:complete len:262 (+),score=43.09 TRINITY_DN13606_c0_g1_i1:1245-2030(+)
MIRQCDIDNLEKEWQQAGERARGPREARRQAEELKMKQKNAWKDEPDDYYDENYYDDDMYYNDDEWDGDGDWEWSPKERRTEPATQPPSHTPLDGIFRYSKNCLGCDYITEASKSVFRAVNDDLARDCDPTTDPNYKITNNGGLTKLSSVCSSFAQCSSQLQDAIVDSVFGPIVESLDLMHPISSTPIPSASTDMLAVIITGLKVAAMLSCLDEGNVARLHRLLSKASREFDLHITNGFPASKESHELLRWVGKFRDRSTR